ncbi:hypothetical protein WJX81_001180 [Elliptochloris bilobata]|uniref:RING-type domain-containing protein n=1 Tax=Elliptochloris bilobata TaxID=381761 RepID=A0AAW1RBK3_9CHLO
MLIDQWRLKLECQICMDARVGVQTNCGHEMCVLCAQAVCAMPNRAVVCPFCRQAITSVRQLPQAAQAGV